jgi:putative ABC transport system substrate-binding protein
MQRRDVIRAIAVSVAARTIPALAQEPTKPPTIGFLDSASTSFQAPLNIAFMQRLRELGWNERQNLSIEYRSTEGRVERSTELANDLVRLKVDIIVAAGTAVAVAAKKATSAIPIVFPLAGDPIENGLVSSLSRPGSNATGLSLLKTDLAAKRLELLRESVPSVRRLAILANAGYPAAVNEMQEVQAATKALGFEVAIFEIRRAEDIEPVFEALKNRAEVLYVCADPLVFANRVRVATLALGARLPTIYDNEAFVEAGGLMSYGPSFADMFRRSAEYVDKILRGAKPADLPVEQPTKLDLVVNLTTAKVIGLSVPPTLLARADKVIE